MLKTFTAAVAIGLCMAAGLATQAGAQTKLKVAYVSLAVSAPYFVAKDKGMFERRGLDVELIPMRGVADVLPSLISGSIDIGMMPISSMLQAADSGVDLVALSGVGIVRAGSKEGALVARQDSGIKEPKDLKGKKVLLINIGSVSQILFEKWLQTNNMSRADIATIQYSEASLPQMVDILKTGTVDAATPAEPFVTAAVRSGSAYVVSHFLGELPDGTPIMVNGMTRTWLTKNPKVAEDFKAAVAEAVTYTTAKANEAEIREAVSRWLKLRPEIANGIPFPQVASELTVKNVEWWIETLNEQGRLRNKDKISAAKFLAQ